MVLVTPTLKKYYKLITSQKNKKAINMTFLLILFNCFSETQYLVVDPANLIRSHLVPYLVLTPVASIVTAVLAFTAFFRAVHFVSVCLKCVFLM